MGVCAGSSDMVALWLKVEVPRLPVLFYTTPHTSQRTALWISRRILPRLCFSLAPRWCSYAARRHERYGHPPPLALAAIAVYPRRAAYGQWNSMQRHIA